MQIKATQPSTHPVRSRLLEMERRKVVSAAEPAGIACKKGHAKEGETLCCKIVKRRRSILCAVMRDLQREPHSAS